MAGAGDAIDTFSFVDPAIDESSGLAVSRHQHDVLWTHNDAGSVLLFDPYTGVQGRAGATGAGDDTYGLLLRFQWQLAL